MGPRSGDRGSSLAPSQPEASSPWRSFSTTVTWRYPGSPRLSSRPPCSHPPRVRCGNAAAGPIVMVLQRVGASALRSQQGCSAPCPAAVARHHLSGGTEHVDEDL
eukprot:1006008-Prymnesium_polylepis.1